MVGDIKLWKKIVSVSQVREMTIQAQVQRIHTVRYKQQKFLEGRQTRTNIIIVTETPNQAIIHRAFVSRTRHVLAKQTYPLNICLVIWHRGLLLITLAFDSLPFSSPIFSYKMLNRKLPSKCSQFPGMAWFHLNKKARWFTRDKQVSNMLVAPMPILSEAQNPTSAVLSFHICSGLEECF